MLQVLQQIQLLPFTLDSVEQKVKAFSNYADEVSSFINFNSIIGKQKISI